MTTQTELNWTRAATPEKLRYFEDTLDDFGGWMKARPCAELVGLGGGECGKRNVRKLAEMSSKVISGNDGYKHVRWATPKELAHFKARLRSQMMRMSERLARLEEA